MGDVLHLPRRPAVPELAAAPPRPGVPLRPAPEPLWREALGEALRRERHDRGERIADVAGRAGVSPQYLSEVERGRKEASSEILSALAGALGLTVREVAGRAAQRLGAASGPVLLAA